MKAKPLLKTAKFNRSSYALIEIKCELCLAKYYIAQHFCVHTQAYYIPAAEEYTLG